MEFPKTPFSNLKNPTGKHKDWYGPEFVKIFCQVVDPKNQYFDSTKLIKIYKEYYKNLELTDRLKLIADLFDAAIDKSYADKLKILERLLGEPLPYEEGMFTYGFYLYPVSKFIEKNGTTNLDKSFQFIKQMTMRFTGEWAVRPLANYNEKRTLKQMKEWSKDENFHVRRLASEGLRAKLPWGQKIQWVSERPEKTLPIYNKLRNDPSLYVRRSVANSMGDLIKINEDLALETFDKWLSQKQTKENLWVIRHAIRTPVKKNNKRFVKLKKYIS